MMNYQYFQQQDDPYWATAKDSCALDSFSWLDDQCKPSSVLGDFDDSVSVRSVKVEEDCVSDSVSHVRPSSTRSKTAPARRPHPYARAESTASTVSSVSTIDGDSDSKKMKLGAKGRKGGSTSKMANYARAYREAKKQEKEHYEHRCKELEVENARIRASYDNIKNSMHQLTKDYENLRRVLQFDSKLAPLVARVTGHSASSSELPPSDVGVCIHVGGAGASLEVCDRCNSKTHVELPSKGLEFPSTELFGGDFDSIAPFIN